jgi:hypothetical protein
MKNLTVFFTRHQKLIFLFLTVLTGAWIFAGQWDYQAYISQGDHGRDLYAFKMITEGAVPYRDFSWLFGPLMLYYYGAFFKWLGASIQSAVIGQNVLILLTGVFLYLTCARFFSPALSLLCALWYWSARGTEFFYTYNHSGGILCMVIMAYAGFSYIDRPRYRYILYGLLTAFLFILIRFNMAACVLAAWALGMVFADSLRFSPLARNRIRSIFYGALACGILALIVYWLYFRGLPIYVLWESFPLSKAQRTDATVDVLTAVQWLGEILGPFFTSSAAGYGILILIGLSVAGTAALLVQRPSNTLRDRRKIGSVLVFCFLLILFTLHEYLLSGVAYRLYWSFPSFLLLLTAFLGYMLREVRSLVVRLLIYGSLAYLAWVLATGVMLLVRQVHNPGHLLSRGETRAYSLQDPGWIDTVNRTCDFIEKNVPSGDKLFTVPFDTLYNFLTGRDQPVRQWVYFQHMIIPEEQQRATILGLEQERVNWILLSNRAISIEPGLGLFGVEYCQVLGRYIQENFDVAANFGPWTREPSWAWNHGVLILKRKTPY